MYIYMSVCVCVCVPELLELDELLECVTSPSVLT